MNEKNTAIDRWVDHLASLFEGANIAASEIAIDDVAALMPPLTTHCTNRVAVAVVARLLTAREIEQMRIDAGANGDSDLVDVCEAAAEGNVRARTYVAEAYVWATTFRLQDERCGH